MENKNNNFETMIKPVIVLTVIALICSALLAVTNNVTAPIIAENERITTLNAYAQVLQGVDDPNTLEEIDGITTANVAAAVKTEDGQIAVKSTASGYDGGVITTILGFDADGNIQGIYSDCSTQTAGMGSKCDDESFTSQFVGLSTANELTLNQDVQQVSGCTVSSKAFVAAVNAAIDCFNEVKGAA